MFCFWVAQRNKYYPSCSVSLTLPFIILPPHTAATIRLNKQQTEQSSSISSSYFAFGSLRRHLLFFFCVNRRQTFDSLCVTLIFSSASKAGALRSEEKSIIIHFRLSSRLDDDKQKYKTLLLCWSTVEARNKRGAKWRRRKTFRFLCCGEKCYFCFHFVIVCFVSWFFWRTARRRLSDIYCGSKAEVKKGGEAEKEPHECVFG